ncbi:MAG: hypothetical protein V2A66_02085 [Pseudomonadota bacterium]
MRRSAALLVVIAAISMWPLCLFAYPSPEVIGIGGVDPPFDFGVTSNLSGFLLASDQLLLMSYGQSLALVDVGSYALEPVQPPLPPSITVTNSDGTTSSVSAGNITAIAYDSGRNNVLASMQSGHLFNYDLNNVSADPSDVKLVDGDTLGPIAMDTNADVAYVSDNTALALQVVSLSSGTLSGSIALPTLMTTSFMVTDAAYNSYTKESYFSTSAGIVFYIASGGTTATAIVVDATGKKNLAALATFPGGDYLYVVDATTPSLIKISTSTHSVVTSNIDISLNPSPGDIVITAVSNPGANYAFVSGAASPGGGVSVVDTATDTVFNLGSDPDSVGAPLPISATPAWLAASSVSDGNIYMGFSTGKMGLLSENPFTTIRSVTYSGGGSALIEGGSFTMTFNSNQTGTYTIKAGGSVSGNGTVLKDSAGNTSGSVTLNTDTSVTINQADNVSAFQEGDNDVWVFVTAGSNIGRRSTTVTLNLPPPDVVMDSTGFGEGRIYVNFERLTVSDMASYRVYVDTDPNAVLTKTDAAATVAQASSGSTQSAEVDGLTDGTTYYVAMDAIDTGGLVSRSRTNTFKDGTVATGLPEMTVGPAAMMGEKGCSVVRGDFAFDWMSITAIFNAVLILMIARKWKASALTN